QCCTRTFYSHPPVRRVRRTLSLKVDGRSQTRFYIVGELGDAQQIRPEHAILHLNVDREPVGRQYPIAAPEVHRETIVAGELRSTNAPQKIEGARQGSAATDEGLAREQVVAQRNVVVREASLSWRKQLNIAAEGLEARAARIGATVFALKEEVLGHVIGNGRPVGILGSEVLDGQKSVVDADLDVRAADVRHLDFAPLDLRVHHAGRS